jgi:hypothetical protein
MRPGTALTLRSQRGLEDFWQALLIAAEYRHNELQSLVDLTSMLHSAATPENYLGTLRTKLLSFIFLVPPRDVGRSSSGVGHFRFVYQCLTQFLCSRREIVQTIATLVEEYPGSTNQIAFVSSWFLPDIRRYDPDLFAKVKQIIQATSFLQNALPIAHDFSDIDSLNDRIFCVFPPDSVGDAIRTDNLDLLTRLANETSFDVTARMPDAFFGCYPLWRDESPTLLDAAAFFGSVNVFKYLILNGALGQDPPTVVPWAFAGGSLEIVRFCIQHQFDLPPGLPAAVLYHRDDIVRWVLIRVCPGFPDEDDEELHFAMAKRAVESGNIWFLKKYEPPRVRELVADAVLLGRRPSFLALSGARGEVTPASAVQGGCVTILRNVLKHASEAALIDAVVAAATVGRPDLLAELVHAPLDKPDCTGCTPLRRACELGHVGCALMLLEKGVRADPAALEAAVQNGHRATVAALLQRTVKPPPNALELAIQGRHLDVVRLLVDAGVDVGDAALRAAATAGFADAAAVLLARPQVDVNGRDDKQRNQYQVFFVHKNHSPHSPVSEHEIRRQTRLRFRKPSYA